MKTHTKCCLLYLGIPNVLFYLFWVKVPIIFFLIMFLGWRWLVGLRPPALYSPSTSKPSSRDNIFEGVAGTEYLLVTACFALLLMAFSGCTHLFYSNYDWYVRDAVYADTIKLHWPIEYASSYYLRAPTGYYLVPGLISSMFHSQVLWSAIFWLWSAFGLFLVIWPIVKETSPAICFFILLVFGGADWLGYLIFYGVLPIPGTFFEWWAKKYQYSSFITSLFWVPNHALPSFLVGSLFCTGATTKQKAIAVFLSAIWSPFAFIAGFLLLIFTAVKKIADVKLIFYLCLLFLPVFVYMVQDITQVAHGGLLNNFPDNKGELSRLFLFIFLQTAPFIILALWKERNAILLVSIGILLLLPLFRFGPGNDLVTRVSLLPLYILFYYAAKAIHAFDRKMLLLVCLFFILWSSPTPLNEFYRVLSRPVNGNNFQQSTFNASHSLTLYARITEHINVNDPSNSYIASKCNVFGNLLLRTCPI